MKWYILLACIIVLVIVKIIISKVKIQLVYKRDGENDFLKLTIIYMRFFKLSREISLIDIEEKDNKMGINLFTKVFGDNNSEKDPRKFVDFKAAIEQFHIIKDFYISNKERFQKLKCILQEKMVVKDLNLKLQFGFVNPAITGISMGIINAIIWNVFTFLSHNVRVEKHTINVIPKFNINDLKIDFDCIFIIKIGNIIYIILQIIRNPSYIREASNLFKLLTIKSNMR